VSARDARRARVPRRMIVGAALLASSTGLAGCSMATGLDASTGNGAYESQSAAINALTANDVPIQIAPVCQENGSGPVTCNPGKTTTGQPITVTVSDGKDPEITVSVAQTVIFKGNAIVALNEAGRVQK